MKSNLMTRNDLAENEDFKKDLTRFFNISQDKREVLVASVIAVTKASSDIDRNKVMEDAAESVGASVTVMKSALAIGRFLISAFLPSSETPVDEPDDLVSDFLEIGVLSPEQQSEAVGLLISLRDEAVVQLDLLIRERSHSQSTIPILESIDGSVDLRMVFDKDFDFSMNLSDFHPKLLSSVPLLVVRLALSGGQDKEVVFQIDPRTLQVLIEHLRSYQRQLNMACEHYKINGSGHEAVSSS
jgi:hypothetical protein